MQGRVHYYEGYSMQDVVIEQVLGRKVRMTQGRKTGRIELEYYDADDREALLQALEAIGRRN